ncbi:bifunctional Delta(1)-pyrroline-2-carboxylate/Delta(1)-piperideine-2-carboxylate reductase [Deinococcus sp.]|uniref:bifunctional Delta(1)-pyrroline-2-carboxylate/Delta(1)-piperideine-2- carboxylate reductase n=1 Tax=Deinococcus sp. TaxID=47478 RepID=UPI0025C3C6B6|nr:bifunctional Delta(1)-pyrroline-2-carboxylate/Delta(1)-piperideine-2-carboxylate reductase [Deinococcus sp.]
MLQLDANQTAQLLPYPVLVAALEQAVLDYASGTIVCPERLVVAMPGGLLLSMPATAPDVTIHKLLTICGGNPALGLPTIQGEVTAYDPHNGQKLLALDAPTATARRTAAISMLGIGALHGQPREMVLIGTGAQAAGHVEAVAAVFPEAQLWVKGSALPRAQAFCQRVGGQARATDQLPESADVIITTTSSKTPVYDLPARAGRLIVTVGAFTPDAAEIAPATVQGSRLYVDDPAGAPHEAGDFIQAGIDWNTVHSLAQALRTAPPQDQPILFKSVGCAAWDLAACRVALAQNRTLMTS